MKRRLVSALFVAGAALAGGATSALLMSHPRYWPLSQAVNLTLIAVGVLAMAPELIALGQLIFFRAR